jgi:hypothetical protein
LRAYRTKQGSDSQAVQEEFHRLSPTQFYRDNAYEGRRVPATLKTGLRNQVAGLKEKKDSSIEFNDHLTGDGAAPAAWAMSIVARRGGLPHKSGRSRRWLKIRNPDSPAIKRLRDETL